MRGRPLDTYYHLLGIGRSASPEELRRAHRDMAQVWHPDRFSANPRLQRIAEEKLREINEAYTVLRCGGKLPHVRKAHVPARASAAARWLCRGAQTVAAAVAVFAMIMSASALHRWWNAPDERAIVTDLSKSAADVSTTPALRRGRGFRADAGHATLSNGTEMVEPRGRRGIGLVTITNHMDRDAVAILVDSNSPNAVVRMVYVSAGRQVALDGIAPGIYRLELSAGVEWNWMVRDFTRNRSASRVGPLTFTQIQSPGQVGGDHYRIVLRQDGPGSEDGISGDGTLRA